MATQDPTVAPLPGITPLPGTVPSTDPTTVVAFDVDPLGFLFTNVKEAAHGLATDLLPWLMNATQPDLSAQWFLDAYRISFAAAVFLWVALLLWNLVRAARRVITGAELAESFTTYSLLFLAGAMYGPAVGWVVVRFFGALSESLLGWASGGAVPTAVDSLADMIAATEPDGVTGGVVVALIVMSLVLLGLILVALVLVVTTVTLYFTGALMPLALAWLVDPAHRRTGTRLITTWVAILAAKPLVFFLLGIALRMTAAQTRWLSTDPRVEQLATLTAAAMAMILAALAPFALLRITPRLPTPNLTTGGPVARGEAGPAGESSVARVARLQSERSSDVAVVGGAGALLPMFSNVHVRPLSAEPGPVQRAAMAQQARDEDTTAEPGRLPAPAGKGGADDGVGAAPADAAGGAPGPDVPPEATPATTDAPRPDGGGAR
jgi:type IV secretion system protein TrbL